MKIAFSTKNFLIPSTQIAQMLTVAISFLVYVQDGSYFPDMSISFLLSHYHDFSGLTCTSLLSYSSKVYYLIAQNLDIGFIGLKRKVLQGLSVASRGKSVSLLFLASGPPIPLRLWPHPSISTPSKLASSL